LIIPVEDLAEKSRDLDSESYRELLRNANTTKDKTITPAIFPTTIYQTPIASIPPTIVPKQRVTNPYILAPVVGLIPRTIVIVIQTPRYALKKL
jgi:hypothetical protein